MAFPQGDTAEELAREAAALAAEGHRVVYIKVGRGHRDDAEIVGAVRDAIGPEPLLRVDPNEAWDVPGAVDAIRRLEEFDLDWVEQPVAAGNVAGLARVRNSVETKIAADQAVHTTAELRAVLDAGGRRRDRARQPRVGRPLAVAADGVPRRVVRDPDEPARLPGERDLDLRRPAGDGAASRTRRSATRSCTTCSPSSSRRPRSRSTGGRCAVPTAPGLGFEIDLDAVERARERYERQGPY